MATMTAEFLQFYSKEPFDLSLLPDEPSRVQRK